MTYFWLTPHCLFYLSDKIHNKKGVSILCNTLSNMQVTIILFRTHQFIPVRFNAYFMRLRHSPSPKKYTQPRVQRSVFSYHTKIEIQFLKLTMVGEKLLIFMSFIHILATSLLEDSFFTVPLLTSANEERQLTFQNKILLKQFSYSLKKIQ